MTTKLIPVTDLFLDKQNPRLEVQESQTEAIIAMAATQKEKLYSLAQDIVDIGLNPGEGLFVIPNEENDKYTVLEGNRRIAAIKILSTPEILVGDATVPVSLQRKFVALASTFQISPIEEVSCVIFPNRYEADPWIILKHGGEQAGAGIVTWGALELERYKSRQGKVSAPLKVLELVDKYGYLTEEAKNKLSTLKITNLTRLIGDPAVREKLGFQLKRGKLYSHYPDAELAKGFSKIVEDIAIDKIKVSDIDNEGAPFSSPIRWRGFVVLPIFRAVSS